MSLRSRILLITLVTCSAALLLSAAAILAVLWQAEKRDSEEGLRAMAGVMASMTAHALAADEAVDPQILALARTLPALQRVCFYDGVGALRAGLLVRDRAGACEPRPVDESQVVKTNRFVVSVPVVIAGSEPGTLVLVSDHSVLRQRGSELLVAVAMALVLAILVAYLLVRRLQGIVTRPLDMLSETAHRITESNDYATRAPHQDAGREIDRLVTAFNHMMRRIDREHRALTTSERRFRTLTENSPVGIFETNANGGFCYVNERFADIVGLPVASVSLAMADMTLHFADGEKFSQKWLTCIQSGDDFMLAIRRDSVEDVTITVVGRAMPLIDDQGVLTGYLGSLTDVTELEMTRSKLEHLAFFDPLTNLANRRMIITSIGQEVALAERGDYQFALMMLDMDEFKRVNDTLGHDAGDVLLKVCAERLTGCVRPSDVVARMGGDEFLVLLRNIRHPEEVSAVAARILQSFRQPVVIGSQQVIVTSSIGISIAPLDGRDPQTLLKNADLAMYNAKAAGRNAWRFFDDGMSRALREQLVIEHDLREALRHEDFELYFQPQIAMEGYHVVGVEALVRWHHAINGMVHPTLFISVAEATGLIIPLGRWIIREACRVAVELKNSGLFPHLQRVSVNLSPKQFHDSKLLDVFQAALVQYGARPDWIEFEITESLLMEDSQRSLAILEQMRSTGVGLAVDDFGTGYSSLSYLKRFPIDTLKIDRSFVMDIPADRSDMEIAAAVIAMAHKLELRVVAEGVETEAQLRFLEENRCDVFQGYLFARPMPLATLLQTRVGERPSPVDPGV